MPHVPPSIATDIKAMAASLGFDVCGFTTARSIDELAHRRYDQWLEQEHHGCMEWAARHQDVRDDPRLLLEGAQSVIMLAMNYYPACRQPADAPQFAAYAYGRDYHEVVRERLHRLAAFITGQTGCDCRCCVDTAPLRERYWAQQAGLGFIGLNNQLIVPGRGSYFFLGGIVTSLPLPPDEPCTFTCGECRACIDACPTQALPADGAVDARRCLSCLTIELRGPLPEWAGKAMGNRVYGCDVCQQCCPHNRHATPTAVPEFLPSEAFLRLTADDIRRMTPSTFSQLFAHSAVRRTKLSGLQRNQAAIDAADTPEESQQSTT